MGQASWVGIQLSQFVSENAHEIFIELPGSLIKKTYGHKYNVAASIGFEEKSYPFIRKMK